VIEVDSFLMLRDHDIPAELMIDPITKRVARISFAVNNKRLARRSRGVSAIR